MAISKAITEKEYNNMTLNELIEKLQKLQLEGHGESKVKIVCWSDEYKVEEPFVDENNEIVL